ncbi:MAG: hypothetical protein HOV73_26615 [Streptomyces sp.]|nr:hypothetical protein [Streptomyces sp.]NUR43661.1 hypothetical protein [Streptomyces sp.]
MHRRADSAAVGTVGVVRLVQRERQRGGEAAGRGAVVQGGVDRVAVGGDAEVQGGGVLVIAW